VAVRRADWRVLDGARTDSNVSSARGRKSDQNPCYQWLKSTVIAYRLNRTTQQRLLTKRLLFLICRLLVNKRIVLLVAAHEIVGRRITANVAVNTRRVHVIRSGSVLFYFLVFVRHGQFQRQGCVMSSGITSLSNCSSVR